MQAYKGYILDLDGTIYNGTSAIPTATTFVEELAKRNIPYLFVTNNATRTADEVVQHLKIVSGIDAKVSQVYTSAMAAIAYIAQHYPNKTVQIVGEPALHTEARLEGLAVVEEGGDVVLQGLNRFVTYEELARANTAIRSGAKFIVTNPDRALPTEDGFLPGAGAITAFLRASSDVEPIIIGKPYSFIMEGALERLGVHKDEVLVVGDNLETDIRAGMNAGMHTLLPYTGVATEESVAESSVKPTYCVADLSEWQVME